MPSIGNFPARARDKESGHVASGGRVAGAASTRGQNLPWNLNGCLAKFIAIKLRAGQIALALLVAATTVRGQPVQPWVNLQSPGGGSNLLFQVTTQSNWFYTFQQSTNLTNWNYATNYYASNTSLNWTNSFASNNPQMFFRVAVNPPNPTVVTNYHSWGNSISVNNGIVEAIIVPTIGRLQQFHFVGDTNFAFWEDPALYGKLPTNNVYKGWGGDKAWPAAQNSWSGTHWPPTDFDRMTNSSGITNGIVTMVSQVDSRFGIRTTRTIELLFNEPVMRVTTTFQRITNTNPSTLMSSNIAVWIDCQANVTTNSRAYIPVPSPSFFAPTNYTLTGDAFVGQGGMPPSFNQANGLISFGPDTATSHKVGFDSGTLILVGTNISLRVDAPRVSGATYTSQFNLAVYTAQYSSTSPFFELELIGPAQTLSTNAPNNLIQFVTTYSLFHRTGATTDAEAQKVLSWQY